VADLQITQLPSETGTVASTDVLAIVNITAAETRKITTTNLSTAIFQFLGAGGLAASKVAAGYPGGSLTDASVTNAKLVNASTNFGGVDVSLGSADLTPAFDLQDATNYPASALTGTITNAQLAGSIANSKLASSSVSFGGISVSLGASDATPAFDLTDATNYKTSSLIGTITNAQLAGSIDVSKLSANTNFSLGGVSISLGQTIATPAFDLQSSTGYLTSNLSGTISNAQLGGSISNSKLANNTVSFGGVGLSLGSADATPAFDLQDATGYKTTNLVGTITSAQLDGSITNSKLQNSSISLGGVSLSLGQTYATPALNLSQATAYPTSSLVGTITNAQLAGSIAGTKLAGGITNAQLAGSIANSKLINSSLSLGGVQIDLGAADATPAFDLQDSTGYKTTNLVGTITNAQLAGSIDASKLVADSLTSTQLGANCVGASELANLSVATASVQSGAITNDKIETSSSSTTGIDGGTKIRASSIPVSKLDASTVGNGLAINSNVLSIDNSITGATSLGLTFSNQGVCTGIAAIQASDLSGVLATSSAVGVVKVPTSGGLTVSGSGDLSLASTVSSHTTRGIAVNAYGQVTSVSATVPSASLPVASTTEVGGIKVPSTSSPLTVDGNGILTIGVSGVTAGTGYTKFNVTDKGIISSAGALAASDIPNISAALLTSGTVDIARIGSGTIDKTKFSNESTTVFGSVTQSGFPSGSFSGQLFFDSVEEDLFLYDGAAWQPVTTLTKGSLKLGGVYSCATSAMTAVTSHGSSVGLTIGQNLPSPTSTTDATYVIVGTGGTPSGIPNGPTGELIPPDYILSVTSSTGSVWTEIDLSTTVSSPTAANVSVLSGYGGSSTNVQNAFAEIYSDFLKVGGGNVTGELKIESSGSFAFEGTANDYETRLTCVDPGTADRLITFPDASGTVLLSGISNQVTSAMITDATIVNGDISATAGIQLSKLAAVSAGQILVGASGTGTITAVTPTGDIAISSAGALSYVAGSITNADINASAGISASKIDAASTSQSGCVQLSSAVNSTSTTLASTPSATKSAYDLANTANTGLSSKLNLTGGTLSGDLIIDDEKSLKFREEDANGDHFVALKAAASLAADVTLTLPSNSPSANFILKAGSSTPTNLEWAADSSTTSLPLAGGTMAGDINLDSNDITNGGTITGTFVGNLTGNCSGTSGGFTAGDASNLDSGTIGTGRLGSGTASTSTFLRGDNSWQAIDLTNLSATNLTSGTLPDARFPATLPAASGANLTDLNGTNIATGTIAAARIATLNQDTSGTAALATEITITANNSTDETCYPVFVDGSTGAQGGETDTGLSYNPSSGLLTSTGFVGSLTGNADTATNANHVSVADNESTDENNLIPFIEDASATGNVGLESDGDFHYNPSTGKVTATAFVGDGSGLTNLPGGGGFSTIVRITASNASWSIPSGVSTLKVTVVGGGGGGGFGGTEQQGGGGGGGAGGEAISFYDVSAGGTAAITIAAGGTAGATQYTSGGAGGASSFVYSGTTTSASGGSGGYRGDYAQWSSADGHGGDGGIGTAGTILIRGGCGGNAKYVHSSSFPQTHSFGGYGGQNRWGGNRMSSSNGQTPGTPQANSGAGGGGGTHQYGGVAGASGAVIIEY